MKNIMTVMGAMRICWAAILSGGMILSAAAYALPPVDAALSFEEAIRSARQNNVQLHVAGERITEALGARKIAAADLLPQVSVSVSQQRIFRENLESIGFFGAGLIGPFNDFETRIRLDQSLFDAAGSSAARAGSGQVDLSREEAAWTRQQVTVAAAVAYLEALRIDAALAVALENVALAREIIALTQKQFNAGIATEVDAARAQTRLAQEEARVTQVRLERDQAYYGLSRITGLPLGTQWRLTSVLQFRRESLPEPETAFARALQERAERRIADKKISVDENSLAAARNRRLPRIGISAGYGLSGNEPDSTAKWVADALLSVRMPVFAGGEIYGQIERDSSRLAQSMAMREDVCRQIEEDVRVALQTISNQQAQVSAQEKILELAERELALAQARFRSGVADNIEVLNAQTNVSEARREYVAVLARYQMARINYYAAIGTIDAFSL